jgi:hypothetical protein
MVAASQSLVQVILKIEGSDYSAPGVLSKRMKSPEGRFSLFFPGGLSGT